MVHKLLLAIVGLIMVCMESHAQSDSVFTASLRNSSEDINIEIDLTDKKLQIDGLEIFGDVAGHITTGYDFRQWIIVDAEIIDYNKALLTIINDYGSEDLKALLTYNGDGKYTLKQQSGSSIKFAKDKKWIKIPKVIELRKK